MESTFTPLNAADQALANLTRVASARDELARAIADNVVAGLPVPPAVRNEYGMACVAVAAAQDMYLDATDALKAAS